MNAWPASTSTAGAWPSASGRRRRAGTSWRAQGSLPRRARTGRQRRQRRRHVPRRRGVWRRRRAARPRLRRSALPQGHPHVDGRVAPGPVRDRRALAGCPDRAAGERLDRGRAHARRRRAAWRPCSRRCEASASALVLGHEGDGLSAAATAACTHLARIPMPRRGGFAQRGDGRRHRVVRTAACVRGAGVMDDRWDVVGIGENSVDHVLRLPRLARRRAEATKIQVSSTSRTSRADRS